MSIGERVSGHYKLEHNILDLSLFPEPQTCVADNCIISFWFCLMANLEAHALDLREVFWSVAVDCLVWSLQKVWPPFALFVI